MKQFKLKNKNGNYFKNCLVIEDREEAILTSYDTIVVKYNKITKRLWFDKWHSETTKRHINAFLSYYGLNEVTNSFLKGID